MNSPGRVLMIFPGALGDLICAGPALAEIARRHRGASIELMARAELAKFAAGRMGVARGHSIDRPEIAVCFSGPGTDLEPARQFFGAFGRVYSFFAAGDAHYRNALESAAGGPVSFHPFRPDGPGHIAAGYLRSIGADGAPLEVQIDPTPGDFSAAARALADAGCDPARTVVIFPGSGSPAKNWPAERFVELARTLARSHCAVAVLGPAELRLESLMRKRGVPILRGLELGTVAAIARRAQCFVGNDSGVSHLAAAAGAQGMVIFGPTDPARWAPIGRVTIIRRDPLAMLEAAEVAAAIARR
ncbi:MAG: glycosyltransferase family 9 protein [Candidatus Binataceae bacterium]